MADAYISACAAHAAVTAAWGQPLSLFKAGLAWDFRVQGFGVQGLGLRVEGLGFRLQGFGLQGFRILGFRVRGLGLGFRV